MYNYYQEFLAAVDRSRLHKLRVPTILPVAQRFLSPSVADRLPQLIYQAVGLLPADQLVANCLNIHAGLLPHMRVAFGEAYFTIGYIDGPVGSSFKFSETQITDWLSKGVGTQGVDFHAWITLSSMEIIDLTIFTSVAKACNTPQLTGQLLSLHPSDLKGGMEYHPMLVGLDFLNRIGAMQNRLL